MRLGTWVPFERLPELLRLFTGARLSASTIQRLTEAAGAAYEAVQTADVTRLERECPAPPMGPAAQQLSVDGAMVPLRGKGVWAEVKTLAIGTVSAAQPLAVKRAGEPAEPEVHVTEVSYFSRMTDHETFARLAAVETHRRGTETAGAVCGVVDGAEWCQSFLDAHRPDAVRILDFSHAAGYLAQIGHAAFGEGTPQAAAWYEQQRHALRHDESPDAVLAAVRAVRDDLATRPAATAATTTATTTAAGALEVVTKSLAYLDKRRDQLRYATFQQHGYPIGSGIVESANKLVVEARLKGAGMHWAPEHVDPMLALRTITCADRWGEAWPKIVRHVRTERHRQRATAATRRSGPCAPCAPCAPCPTAVPPTPPTAQPAAPAAAPGAPPVPRTPLSYGPGRPAPNHPWKRRFVTPARRSPAPHGPPANS